MTDKERRASKYLPFDALKGLKEEIENMNNKTSVTFPDLSEDEKMAMDSTLFECYSHNKAIVISYFENGSFNNYTGVIEKIDVINRQIFLIPKKRFRIENIMSVTTK